MIKIKEKVTCFQQQLLSAARHKNIPLHSHILSYWWQKLLVINAANSAISPESRMESLSNISPLTVLKAAQRVRSGYKQEDLKCKFGLQLTRLSPRWFLWQLSSSMCFNIKSSVFLIKSHCSRSMHNRGACSTNKDWRVRAHNPAPNVSKDTIETKATITMYVQGATSTLGFMISLISPWKVTQNR